VGVFFGNVIGFYADNYGKEDVMFNQKLHLRFTLSVLLQLWLILSVLSACTSASQPLRITSVSVTPEPRVGEIVTLEVEVTANNDESDVIFTVDALESAGNKIHFVSGDSQQQVSLIAHQPQTFQVEVCVVQEGSWPIEIRAVAHHPDSSLWDAFEIIHLESTLESGKLIRSRDYTYNVGEVKPTPRPVEVSSECSGQQK
jgi:hypothetical protein